MFKHILIPTDGSELARKAIEAGIAFARQAGARVTGYCALEGTSHRVFGEGYGFPADASAKEFDAMSRKKAADHLSDIEAAARDAGVPFEPVIRKSASPHEGIIEAARERNCDVIFMASHGRRGFARLALGSVTNQVLAQSKIPVLVYR